MKHFDEETLHTNIIYEGRLIRLEELTVRLPDGKQAKREVVRHPGAVTLMPLLEDKMLLVHQYRTAPGMAFWETPAGKLEPGEDPMQCAQRELIEETGYRAERLTELRRFFLTPGFCDEDMILFRAENLVPDTSFTQDKDEFLKVKAFTIDEMDALVAQGQIRDAKTMLTLELWKHQAK